jgi:hypothetical protein
VVVRPRRFLRALAARAAPTTLGAAVVLPLGAALAVPLPAAGAAPVPAAVSARGPAQGSTQLQARVPAEPDTAPLRVRIDSMSKTSLPARGTMRISGTVTNRSEETWTTIRLYTFSGTRPEAAASAPMTTAAELAAAMDVPYDASVGPRQVDVGEEAGQIDVLEPGETAPYVVRVPVEAVGLPRAEPDAAGVYWFGVHALGQGGALPRDDLADGRARTFLPYVPRDTDPVPAAVVVPLTTAVLHDSDGSLDDEERWQERLSPGGRLRELLDLGTTAASAGVPLTWLVDPALLDAIGRLALGNPARSLAPSSVPTDDEPAEPTGLDPSGAPDDGTDDGTDGGADGVSDDGTEDGSGDEEPATDSPVALAAQEWLAVAGEVFTAGEVASLPYGNPDVAATERVDPGLLDLALAQESEVLAALDVDQVPVLAHPAGYVDAELVEAAPDGVPLLVADRYLARGAAPEETDGTEGAEDPDGTDAPEAAIASAGSTPALASVEGQPLVVTSSGAEKGSPGPGRSITAVGLRQRLLAEAAVRALPGPDGIRGAPLVFRLPTTWDLSTAEELFDGLSPSWLDVDPLSAVIEGATARTVPVEDLPSPDPSGGDVGGPGRALEPETVEAVEDLIVTGDTLQRILVDNTELGARVTEEALSGLSYAVRRQQRTARTSLVLSRSWLDTRLGSVEVAASSGVTLSGDSGSFLVTLTNDLDERVRVGLASTSDDDLAIEPVEPLELGPQSRTTVLLDVTTSTSRVHNVTLMVTDGDGLPIGSSDQLPIRSVLVSEVIWVIIGVGVGTLFLAIALRLRRRILAARHPDASPDASTA